MDLKKLFYSFIFVFFVFTGCTDKKYNLINSESFSKDQILLFPNLVSELTYDSISYFINNMKVGYFDSKQISELTRLTKNFKSKPSDGLWNDIEKKWLILKSNYSGESLSGEIENNEKAVVSQGKENLQLWIQKNISLLKLTGDVRFADEIEQQMLRNSVSVSDEVLKSIVFTHVFDNIYLNLFVPSELTHDHTTGGKIRLTQSGISGKNMSFKLSCECLDTRYLSVFIRIPDWAKNPTVAHGNVKYVARPGEYTEISKKWRNADVFEIKLINE